MAQLLTAEKMARNGKETVKFLSPQVGQVVPNTPLPLAGAPYRHSLSLNAHG
jgi:hypothetical protein